MTQGGLDDASAAGSIDALAMAARDGDAAALEALLHRIRPLVLARCSHVLPHQQDAQDACQEAMIAVVRGLPGYRGRSRFTTWLYPVATHAAFATYRRMRRLAVDVDRIDAPNGRPGEAVDPIRVSVLAGARVDLVDALERLRQEYPLLAEAVVLRDVAGLSYDEVADSTGVPLGTVKSRINHGRARLRELLS